MVVFVLGLPVPQEYERPLYEQCVMFVWCVARGLYGTGSDGFAILEGLLKFQVLSIYIMISSFDPTLNILKIVARKEGVTTPEKGRQVVYKTGKENEKKQQGLGNQNTIGKSTNHVL